MCQLALKPSLKSKWDNRQAIYDIYSISHGPSTPFNEHATLFANLESKQTNTERFLGELVLNHRCACTGTPLGPVLLLANASTDLTRPLHTTVSLTRIPPPKKKTAFASPGKIITRGIVVVVAFVWNTPFVESHISPTVSQYPVFEPGFVYCCMFPSS